MLIHRVVASGVGTAVVAAVLVLPASTSNASVTETEIAQSLDLPAGVTATLTGSAVVADEPFNDFGTSVANPSYLVMSTGDAAGVFGSDPGTQLSTDVGDDGQSDATTLTLTVAQGTKVGASAVNAGCLFVDFAMGTEERVHTYTEASPSDAISIVRAADPATDHAVNAGPRYFSQGSLPAEPARYEVNAIDYWHQPGDPSDPVDAAAVNRENPRLGEVTALNHVTTRDTARVPIDVVSGAETFSLDVRDAVNGDLDSVAFVDRVRVASSCDAGTGVEPIPANAGGIIYGKRQVGSVLAYDPVPSTSTTVETYDSASNGWRSPSAGGVELRFRWYRTTTTYAYNGDMTRWTAIPDADRQFYVPTNLDRGKVLLVMVTGVVDGRRIETFPSTDTADSWYVTTAIEYGQFDAPTQLPTVEPTTTPYVTDVVTATIGNTIPRQDNWEFRWYARNPGSSTGSQIAGQTGQSLVLSEAQAGKQVYFRATAVRSGFTDQTWTSTATPTVLLRPLEWPGAAAVPSITADGDLVPGVQLTADAGVGWPEEVTDWTFQWQADGATVGAGATYTTQPADAGKDIAVVVKGAPAGYTPLSVTSAPISLGAHALSASPVPVIAGEVKVDVPVTVDVGTWQPSPVALKYQWLRNGSPISGATTSSYTPVLADGGTTLSVAVTSNKIGYEVITRTSAGVAVVGRDMVGATPTITGTVRVGERLTGSASGWAPSYSTLTYAWYAGDTLLQTGASRYYTIGAAALRQPITLRVTGAKAGYASLTRESAATAAVAPGQIAPGTPRISGTATVGSTLRAVAGYWRPSNVTFRYRWKIGSAFVTGTAGTRSTLTVPRAARGKRITLVVTGSLPGYAAASRTSSPTATVR